MEREKKTSIQRVLGEQEKEVIERIYFPDKNNIKNLLRIDLGEGESYVWVIDSRFTNPPNDFKFEVGIERLFFDLAGTGQDFVSTLLAAITDPFGLANRLCAPDML